MHEPEIMPNAGQIEFKDAFIERYNKLTDFELFKKYSLSFLRRSIRVNTLKKPIKEVAESIKEKGWKLTQVPWCEEGFWIESERRDVGNLEEHMLGYIYIQEAASMIPPIVLEPKENEIILDSCAAPGSKTTQIAQYMKNTGLLIANDFKTERIKSLGLNTQRMGLTNVVITLMKGEWFKGMQFDRILVDAPCTGTGTIRKSLKTLRMWNPNMVSRLSAVQKKLITNAFNNLKSGGIMVYSTCTLEPEEDEEVVDYLLQNNKEAVLEDIDLNIKRSKPVLEFDGKKYDASIKKCLRIWPQDNDTEGFFVAKIRKK